ncbi:MAG: CarD family transcriptional regulator [Lachnospiraceae bacterium]|nr:CarD family transcriptional regulator [Lachnospiraceae bacterium]
MFQVNDVVIYGHHGVCEITNVGTLKMPMADQEKLYYTLRPVYHKESSVYAPVENRKIVMRSVITKEEAENLIQNIPRIETVWIVNEKAREVQFKEAMQTCDCEELVKIIKTLYLRKQQRLESGKKVTVVDEKYFRQAEDKLYEELAYALGMEKKQVGTYISQHMEEKV